MTAGAVHDPGADHHLSAGLALEWTEIIIIFMPIFIPLLPHFHIDPLFFGLLVALNLQTAFLSPPVAMASVLTSKACRRRT